VWSATEPDDEAVTAPKLNVVPIDKTFGFADCLDIISANQRLETYKVTVNPHTICPVLSHPPPLNRQVFGRHPRGGTHPDHKLAPLSVRSRTQKSSWKPKKWPSLFCFSTTGRVRNRTDKYFDLVLFFSPLWAAGKNPTQSYYQCSVRFVPNAKSG
jgi:hypothetical protein